MIPAILWYAYLSTGRFPIPLLTDLGSSTVMVVFRDRDGNTAVSGGEARFSAGSRSLSIVAYWMLPICFVNTSSWYDLGVRASLLHIVVVHNVSTTASGVWLNSSFLTPALFIGSVDPATSLVQFNPSTYSVNEHEPSVTLSVERVGNTSMALVIDFSTTAGTALGMLWCLSSWIWLLFHFFFFTRSYSKLIELHLYTTENCTEMQFSIDAVPREWDINMQKR